MVSLIQKKFEGVNPDNCFISEISLAELKFGVEIKKDKWDEIKGKLIIFR